MIIIIDGIDKCGKTTLSRYLLNNIYNSIYIKSGMNGADIKSKDISNYYNNMLKIFKKFSAKYVFIVDRFFMSEYSYSFMRGYECFNKYKNLEDELCKMNHLYIYCFDNIKNIIKRLNNDYISEKEVKKVVENFEFYNKNTMLNFKKYNFNNNKENEVLNWVSNFL